MSSYDISSHESLRYFHSLILKKDPKFESCTRTVHFGLTVTNTVKQREKERIEHEKRFEKIESHMGNISGIEMPSSEGLPPSQSNNPWFIGHLVTRTKDDYFDMASMGIRHVDDIVFWLTFEAYPKCYLRLVDDVVEKDDKVTNET